MAHITSQTATQAQSHAVPSESSLELEDSDTSKEGTHSDKSVSESVSTMSPNSFMADEKPDHIEGAGDSASASLEDTSCGVKNKRMNKSRKETNVVRDSRSECRAIKGGAGEDSAVSPVPAEQEEGCVTLNLATSMERVNPDLYAFGRSGSPYPSSENDWEASDHSDTDADHSDSSDDDNPTSQVDRMIECGARLIMDGENSNLSSETDDTDDDDDDFEDDSDSDITDVSPLMSNAGSPLGLSPVMSRRNLPSSISSKPPFMKHYSHRGHDGDVEDEEEEEKDDFPHWATDDMYASHDNTTLNTESANMSLVVQALLNLKFESRNNSKDNLDSANENDNSHPHIIRNRHTHVSSALQANPHHRHLRKGGNHSRRKNMSFTNEEVRIINRDNTIMLEKLIAVSNRPDKTSTTTHTNPNYRQGSKPASASVNRRHQEEGIRKDNLAILRRLQEVKPSRGVAMSRSSNSTSTSGRHHHHHSHYHHKPHHHSSHHHHHHSHHHKSQYSSSAASSCSATARQSTFSPPHHHSPKETAL